MANLVLTNACGLNCAFCFAGEYRAADAMATRAMSLAEVQALSPLVGPEMRLCGGEPTLHPQFAEILTHGLSRHERVFLMTNGLWPDAVRESLRRLPRASAHQLTYLFNVLPPGQYAPTQQQALNASLAAVPAERVALGITLDAPEYDPAFALGLAARHGIGQLRLSLAAPTITEPRSWLLEPERDFPRLATTVSALLATAERAGVRVQSDCAYLPPCLFTAAQRQAFSDTRHDLSFTCQGPVDIGHNEAWRCFGLYALWRLPLAEYGSLAALDAELCRRTTGLDPLPLLDACRDCTLRLASCGGGCYAFRVVRAARARAARAGVDLGDEASLGAAIATIDSAKLRRYERRAGDRWLIEVQGEWVDLHATALEVELLERIGRGCAVAQLAENGRAVAATLRAVRRLHALGGITLAGDPETP